MNDPFKDLTPAQKAVAYLFIGVIILVVLLLVGVGLIKFLQWAF